MVEFWLISHHLSGRFQLDCCLWISLNNSPLPQIHILINFVFGVFPVPKCVVGKTMHASHPPSVIGKASYIMKVLEYVELKQKLK